MNVPLVDLNEQYHNIEEEIDEAIFSVIETQRFVMGDAVTAFEESMAEYLGVKHAIGCASGSDALLISLMSIGVGAGDVVVTVPYTFFATAGAIARLGARPAFVDIDRRTYNMDPTLLADFFENDCEMTDDGLTHKESGGNVVACIPVHLYGQTVDYDPISEICQAHEVRVIEDAAQAIGAVYKPDDSDEPRLAGTLGDAAAFSFYPTKNLGAFGDGGMIATNDDEIGRLASMLRTHGAQPKYYHRIVGMNSRLDSLQASVLSVKLRYLDEWSETRGANADYLLAGFKEKRLIEAGLIAPPLTEFGNVHVYHQYVIRADRRDDLRSFLKENEIGTETYYPLPLHMQECFAYLGYKEGDFPVSERASKETVALPVYPELTQRQLDHVIDMIGEFYQK